MRWRMGFDMATWRGENRAVPGGEQAAGGGAALLDRGANPNLANSDGFTPLMEAAYQRLHADSAAADGGEGRHRRRDPRTWLDRLPQSACDHNQPDCAEALVRAGCDTTARNDPRHDGA